MKKVVCAVSVLLLATGCLGLLGGEQPSPDHSVTLHNAWNETATFDITVVREATNESVHDETYKLDPGDEREVYNTEMASPNGVENFELRWAVRNQTGSYTIRTNSCHRGLIIAILEDGTARSIVMSCD